jgi:hypothetical protein
MYVMYVNVYSCCLKMLQHAFVGSRTHMYLKIDVCVCVCVGARAHEFVHSINLCMCTMYLFYVFSIVYVSFIGEYEVRVTSEQRPK